MNRQLLFAVALFNLVPMLGCEPSAADIDSTRGGRVDVYFNEPGTRRENMWNPDAVDVMIDLVDNASVSIDFAVMGFTYAPLVDAFERAFDRGVQIRMVGDAGHIGNYGYQMMRERELPLVVGNDAHIMHNKFMVVDDRFVFSGTANWSNTDLIHNSNNFYLIDSPYVAADFSLEFEQLFAGVFGHNKVSQGGPRRYQVGDTSVETWFSPNEDAMGRILELVDASQDSVRFTIFAFTKDQVGSALIRKQAQFDEKTLASGKSLDLPFRERSSVAGVIDKSQLHSNGQYHEVYRLLAARIPMVQDGNDNSYQPGDYQAGGGRLHSKTMIIDTATDDPTVISGSFNWSASATQSNDEFLMVFKSPRVSALYDAYFETLWDNGSKFGIDFIEDGDLQPGDVVINEIMWYGVHDGDVDGFDEFIELRNLSNRDIRLDMWSISGVDDVVVGFPPGSIMKANSTFLVLDHVLETYVDGAPQDQTSAFTGADLVLNPFNDNRQARMYLKDGAMELILRDPAGRVMDIAGDGGPAFAGGPKRGRIYSMERKSNPGNGANADAWKDCSLEEGGVNVNAGFKSLFIASPGEQNSP